MDCNNETDAELLTLMGWRKDDELEASRAFREFYSRYFNLLTRMCEKKYKGQLNEQEIEDLVSETFLRVFEKSADKFKTDEKDLKKLRHHIGAWLGGIAYNLFRMRHRAQKRLPVFQFEDDFDPQSPVFDHPEEDSMSPARVEQHKRLQSILDDLTDKERDILLTRFANSHRSEGKQQFRSEDLERLTSDWELTKDNVRQIFNRTLKKVRAQLS